MKEYTIQSIVRVYGWEELTPEDRNLIEAAKNATDGSYINAIYEKEKK